jgi:hypothetical protein
MTEPPRDWDKELAAIDRAMARHQPQAEPPPAKPGSAPALPAPQPTVAKPHKAAGLTTWMRVGLAAVLALAMPFWPYEHGCGIGLATYLGAAVVVVLAGIWGAVSSWRRHRGVAHIVALLVTLWGLGLVMVELLPRVGYAKQVIRWTCG